MIFRVGSFNNRRFYLRNVKTRARARTTIIILKRIPRAHASATALQVHIELCKIIACIFSFVYNVFTRVRAHTLARREEEPSGIRGSSFNEAVPRCQSFLLPFPPTSRLALPLPPSPATALPRLFPLFCGFSVFVSFRARRGAVELPPDSIREIPPGSSVNKNSRREDFLGALAGNTSHNFQNVKTLSPPPPRRIHCITVFQKYNFHRGL